MAWTTQTTLTLGGVVAALQIGDQTTDLGHRITLDGTPGDAFPLGEVARNGVWRGLQPEFDLTRTISPRLYKAQTTADPSSFGTASKTATITAASISGTGAAMAVANGDGEIVSVAFISIDGNQTNADRVDIGGGADDATVAARIKTALDLNSLSDLTVTVDTNVVTLAAASGVVADGCAGVVIA